MNGIVRNALRISSLRGVLSSSSAAIIDCNQSTRTLWNMCARRQTEIAPLASLFKLHDFRAQRCYSGSPSKVEKDLVEFLAEEIVAEKKARKLKPIPTTLNGFSISLDAAQVTLEKQDGADKIRISFNVNHTLDSNSNTEDNSQDVEIEEMKSKPYFSVDIIRGNQTLGFTCSYSDDSSESLNAEAYNDIFVIDEITLYEGEHTDQVYTIAGVAIDSYLYDLLMNYLEEKGISNDFAEKLMNLSTSYEHTAYVGLLEGLSKFTSGK